MSFVPLTTTFTPASSCLGSNNIWQIIYTTPCSSAREICSEFYYIQGPPSTSDCLPSSYQAPGDPVSGFTFYYPGICPSGYEIACSSTKSLGPYTATAQICCPSRFVSPLRLVVRNYAYPKLANSFECQSSPSLEWQTTLGCYTPFTITTTIAVTVSETGATTTALVSPNGAVNAYAIAVATQNPGFSNPTVQSTGSPNSTTSQAPAATKSSGLNTTGEIIIGVLGALLTIVIISILAWIGFRWHKNRRRKSGHVLLDSKPPRSSLHSGTSETELRPLNQSRLPLTRFASLQR